MGTAAVRRSLHHEPFYGNGDGLARLDRAKLWLADKKLVAPARGTWHSGGFPTAIQFQ